MADPVIKKSGVYQEFNLREIFGVDFKAAPELREAIGQAIIDKIRSRTEEGLAIGGKRELAKYSDEYVESLAFKAAGKSEGEINMTQSGDMLALMDIIEQTANKITIGWSDETQNLKAFNHNTGDTVTKRDFFGLAKSEINAIKKEFAPEVREAAKSARTEEKDDFTKRALDFLNELEGIDAEEE